MSGSKKFASFPGGAEYHAMTETPCDRQSVERGGVNVGSLDSLCGVRVGPDPSVCGAADGGRPSPRIYAEPPTGLPLCRACERLMVKRKGWPRLLSHLFQNKRGFRFGVRSMGRRV